MKAEILVVDDDPEMCRMLVRGLETEGHAAQSAVSAADALSKVESQDVDVVITDVRMPRIGGIALCERLAEIRPDLPVIVVTAFGSVDTAVEALRAGAYDFIVKPFEIKVARAAVRRAIEHRRLTAEVRQLRAALRRAEPVDGMLGHSAAMVAMYDLIARVAVSEATVLVTGESGTGKELVARAIHAQSGRSAGPFVAVNCAAMPEALLESELFGHVRGAFTDARTDRRGLLREAEGGTLLLDEVGELPVALQPKLLRVLQERRVRPVGSATEFPIDVRVVAATNRDLERSVEDGTFREDLYYRLNVVEIPVPPLRARAADILLLAQAFVETFAERSNSGARTILPAAAKRLCEYHWPGNVRQLQNTMERAVALARGSEITVEDLPQHIQAWEPPSFELPPVESLVPMSEVERRYVERVFEASGGNKSLAASILGFNRKTLYRKLRRYGLIEAGDEDGDGVPERSSIAR